MNTIQHFIILNYVQIHKQEFYGLYSLHFIFHPFTEINDGHQ